ncbi:teichoic acid glycosyl transferase [Weissella tructae]|uniref:Teichoic acid/polysaccharide glycosyl transferase n=2 Tax=Weissella TaxID=46255 RepID=A0ABN4DJ95_9LACO|nr:MULTISPECIES: hypothetical protein [Weissella]AIG65737.1 teichoic acid/polysaccharide glycosyl transferase [Weissella tructae]AIM64452.1 teichoic acid/polysaccharide glycosyl transferase [Weissella ceti]ELA06810.1 putative teichoic acid/polysaccharide glycosyl transferase [Weissella ceti NC36]QVV90902.1 teichoic acid glycosyl transferase [Weissella tructae]
MFNFSLRDLLSRISPYLFPFLILLIVATLYMGSSPLYLTNPWDDSNAMLTMGRSIQQGLIPFVDIVEQRGPFIYFLYALGAGISTTSFLGVFVIEVINITLIYYFGTRLTHALTKQTALVPWLALIAPLTLLGTSAFRFGGSPEEFAFTSVLYLLVLLVENDGRFSNMSLPTYFWLGLNLGFIFWNKYSLVGTFAIFFLLCGFYLLFKGRWLHFIRVVTLSLLGFFVAALPILIYYASVGHLDALFNIYFVQNLTSYHVQHMGVIDQLSQLFDLIFKQIYSYIFGWTITALGWILAIRKGHTVTIEIILAFGSIVFVALQKVVFVYYPLVWLPFLALGFIRLAVYICDWLPSRQQTLIKYTLPVIITSLCILGPLLSNASVKHLVPVNGGKSLSGHTYTAQPQFGALMKSEKEHPTLLTLNCIDVGFFLSADTVPVTPYYHRMNMSYKELPIMYDTFKAGMSDGNIDYTVVRVKHALTDDKTSEARQNAAIMSVDSSLKSTLAANYHVVDVAENQNDMYYVLFARNAHPQL